MVEDSRHVDLVRIDKPPHLEAVHHGDDLGGQRLTVSVGPDLACPDAGMQRCSDARPPPRVRVLEPVARGWKSLTL
jgi:hypothetical protein